MTEIYNEKDYKNKSTQKVVNDNNEVENVEENNTNDNTEEMSDSESSSDEDRKIVILFKAINNIMK